MRSESPLCSRLRAGLTLIELLVVVAIIAILAAIAVPNLLEAQTRAKYSRILADLRTMATAIESYAVDQNRPPRMSWGAAPYNDRYTGYGEVDEPIFGTLGPWITTPISYIAQFDMLDHFCGDDKNIQLDARLYTYHDLYTHLHVIETGNSNQNLLFGDRFDREFGAWAVMSLGPDKEVGVPGGDPNAFWIQYDATNGTISPGNIWRSQKSFDQRYYDLVTP